MTSYRDRKAVRRLALEYGMPESYIRQMLAIESGIISGDVDDAETCKPGSDPMPFQCRTADDNPLADLEASR